MQKKKPASIWYGPILFFKGIIPYSLPMLELFEVDGGDKINGFTGTGSLGLIKSMMSGGDSGCFCGKAISLLNTPMYYCGFNTCGIDYLQTTFRLGKATHSLTHTPKTFLFFVK